MIGPCNWCKDWSETLTDKGFCTNCASNASITSLVDELDAIVEDNDVISVPREPRSVEPIRAYKSADIVITFDIDFHEAIQEGKVIELKDLKAVKAEFVPCTRRAETYSAEGIASCHRLQHDEQGIKIPAFNCACGFYGWKNPAKLDEYGNAAKLQVDFSGKVIECAKGYRAEVQHVMRVDFPHICLYCKDMAQTLGILTSCTVAPLCNAHAAEAAKCIRRVTAGELSDLLETEVIWEPRRLSPLWKAPLLCLMPMWAIMGAMCVLASFGWMTDLEYYIGVIAVGIADIPYNRWLNTKIGNQYFHLPHS